MSIEALNWSKKVRTGNYKAKLVLLVLADYANHDNVAWPSIQTIQEDTELGKSGVKRGLDILKEKGLISAVRRYRDDGSPISNQYQLHVGRGLSGLGVGPNSTGGRVHLNHKPPVEPPKEEQTRTTPDGAAPEGEGTGRCFTCKQEHESWQDCPPATPVAPTKKGYPEWFERAWKHYPKLSKGRGNPKRGAYLAAKRWLKDGYTEEDLVAASAGYAASRPDPRWTKMAQTFYGPTAAFEEYIEQGQRVDTVAKPRDTSAPAARRVVTPEEMLGEDLSDLF